MKITIKYENTEISNEVNDELLASFPDKNLEGEIIEVMKIELITKVIADTAKLFEANGETINSTFITVIGLNLAKNISEDKFEITRS